MIDIVTKISGGQTGADRGGLNSAFELGISHGGHCPKGRLAEDGSIPPAYQLIETDGNDYRTRTRLNVDNADVTLLFSHTSRGQGPGTLYTQKYCDETKKPYVRVMLGILNTEPYDAIIARQLRTKLKDISDRLGRSIVINVAGSRESRCPGIQKRVENIICFALANDGRLERYEGDDLLER